MVTLKYDLPYDLTVESVPERGASRFGGPKSQPINMNLLESLILNNRQISTKDPARRKQALDTLGVALHLTLAAFRKLGVSAGDVNRLNNDFVGKQGSARQTLMDTMRNHRRRLSNPNDLIIAVHDADNWVWTQDATGDLWTYRLK